MPPTTQRHTVPGRQSSRQLPSCLRGDGLAPRVHLPRALDPAILRDWARGWHGHTGRKRLLPPELRKPHLRFRNRRGANKMLSHVALASSPSFPLEPK